MSSAPPKPSHGDTSKSKSKTLDPTRNKALPPNKPTPPPNVDGTYTLDSVNDFLEQVPVDQRKDLIAKFECKWHNTNPLARSMLADDSVSARAESLSQNFIHIRK